MATLPLVNAIQLPLLRLESAISHTKKLILSLQPAKGRRLSLPDHTIHLLSQDVPCQRTLVASDDPRVSPPDRSEPNTNATFQVFLCIIHVIPIILGAIG